MTRGNATCARAPNRPTHDIQRELQTLAADLKRLEAEYNMFFAGRAAAAAMGDARPGRSARQAVGSRADPEHRRSLPLRDAADPLPTFVDLWDRAMRASEEGRPGPFAAAGAEGRAKQGAATIARWCTSTSFQDPVREIDKLHVLYDSLMDARRQVGDEWCRSTSSRRW